jgi:hypothetical protein
LNAIDARLFRGFDETRVETCKNLAFSRLGEMQGVGKIHSALRLCERPRQNRLVFASARTLASNSSIVFGGPAYSSMPNTSLVRAGANAERVFSSTPSAVSSMVKKTPASQFRRCLIDFGRTTCPLVDSLTVRFSLAVMSRSSKSKTR